MKRATIYIDGSPNDAESLRCAVRFCERAGARLRVIHAREPEQIVVAGGGMPTAIDNKAQSQEKAQQSKSAYEEVCGDLAFTQWSETQGDLLDAITRNALLNDVTIIERLSDEEGAEVQAFNTALFETGAPVLVTPPAAPATVGKSVIVAWGATIQATRAIRSALGILQKAQDVWVLTNTANKQADPIAIADYLGDYGIEAQTHEFSSEKQTARGRGRAMLAAAKELPADLLVMGAYGENAFSAIFGLGRATRKIVTASPIPVLIQR